MAIEYKLGWEKELRRREALGVEAPAPFPHPDDIVINMKTGQVEIRGPMTKEEQEDWEKAEHSRLITTCLSLKSSNDPKAAKGPGSVRDP